MRSRKLLALLFCLITFPAIAGYMTLLGAGVGNISPTVSWVAGTDTFPDTSLTYSGPSLSTMFDSTGKLTYKPNNLLTQSNTFNTGWSLGPVTLSSGVSDPIGGSNAWTATATGAGAQVTQNASAGSGNFITAYWVRRRTGSGTISIYSPNAVTPNAISVTGSWQQFYVVGASSGTAYAKIVISNSGDAIDIYAATLSAVTYETSPRPGDQVITTSSAYYGPRIDYDPNTLAVKGLLIEEARTNLALQSNTLSNASWSRNLVGAPAQNVTGIDGTTSAWTITASGTADTFLYQTGSFVGPYTYSAVFKAGTNNWAYIAANGGGSKRAYVFFDLTNGVVGSTTVRPDGAYAGTLTGYGIIPLGNGFYRCWMAVTGTTDTYVAFGLSDADASTTTTSGRTIIAGDLEAEAGAFPTSILRTTAASVTRAADVVQFTGAALAALQGSAWSAAVQFADVASYAGNPSIFDTSSNLQTVFMNGNKAAFFPTSLNTANGLSVLASHRIAASATRSGGRSIVSDGGTVATDATAMTSPPNTYLGSNVGIGNFLNGHVASFAIYNQRLPDATLQAKSVVGASYAANNNGIRYAFADNDNLPIHWRVAL